jgi:hypothetical protein
MPVELEAMHFLAVAGDSHEEREEEASRLGTFWERLGP